MTTFPRVLIGSPTAKNKSYCDFEWIDNTLKTNYPNFKVVLFDNSDDNGEYCARLNDYYKQKYNGNQFEAIKSDTSFCSGLIAKVCQGHNDIRRYALDNGFDYLYHLESDVMTQPHTLQELLLHNKQIAGALYYRDLGRFRKLMLQTRVYRSPHSVFHYNADQTDDAWFIDGILKEASHIGLGAILIRRDVLEKIPFRYVEGVHVYPDSYFQEDCFRAKIKIFADTLLICSHKNQDWNDVYEKSSKF